jgi:endonuclease/exonuclease/phosphatase family metal-dependent hydrolase
MAKAGVCRVKLVQLNLWGGRLETSIKQFLEEEQADILCLQEAISYPGESGMFVSIENIQAITKLEFAAVAPKFSFNFMDGVARFSNCILSRYPIKHSDIVFTGLEHLEDFSFNHHSHVDARNFVHTTLEINNKRMNVLTHHGHHIPGHKDGDTETMKQMSILGHYLDKLSGPIILTGDFNLAPHSDSLEQINRRLTNLSLEHRLKTTRTSLTYKTEVCDYIFVNEDVKVNGFRASDDLVSDHKALILEFSV